MYKFSLVYLWFVFLGILLLFGACNGSKKLTDEASTTREVTEVAEISQYYIPTMINDGMAVTDDNPTYKASRKRVCDLLHTKLSVHFDWAKQHVHGEAWLRLKPFFYKTDLLILDAKGFDIHQISLQKNKKQIPLQYEYNGLKLFIQLDKAYEQEEEFEVYIHYTAKPRELLEAFPDISEDNQGLFFIDPLGTDPNKPTQIWTQGETEASSCWFPTIDSPNERTSQELAIRVKQEYTTLSNGLLVNTETHDDGTRTDYWKQDLPHAPYLFMMSVGEFAIVTDKWRDKELSYYVEKPYEKHAKAIFGNTPEMMEFYSNLLDYDFPWDKYAQIVVRDFVAGAMENTTAVTFYEDLHMTTRELLDNNHEDIIAHELVHHWFGDLVTCESWANLALNESFATYGEYLWMAYKYGQDDADYHLNKDLVAYLGEANYKKEPIIRFYHNHRDEMFDRHTYQKGGRVLHMLRHYLGDEAFFTAVRQYVKNKAFRSAEIHDLRLAFEEVCGEDLNWFFNQWFMEKGHPELEIQYKYSEAAKQMNVLIRQKQVDQGIALFRLPISIDIYHSDSHKDRKYIVLEDTLTTLIVPAATPPLFINVDADKVLLARKQDRKSPAEFVQQFHLAPLFLDRYEAIKALYKKQDLPEARAVMLAALEDKSWVIRREAISMIALEEKEAQEKAIPLLEQLATKDERSQVRAMAITKLRGLRSPVFQPIFESCLSDQSYIVLNAALLGLYDINKNAAVVAAQKLENQADISLMNRIARIYAEKGNIKQQAFFEHKLKDTKAFTQYAFMEDYANFMKRLGDKTIEIGLPTLEKIAIQNDDRWLRLNATKAISMLRDDYRDKKHILQKKAKQTELDQRNLSLIDNRLNELNQVLDNIKSSEIDTSLIEFYEDL